MSPADPTAASRAIRQKILARRRAMGEDEISAVSGEVIRRFFLLSGLSPRYFQGLRVALYQALPSELSLLALEERLVSVGARLFFPRIRSRQDKELDFVEIAPEQLLRAEKAHQAWQEGPYGIQEPHPDLPAAGESFVFDLIFVPGVAFGTSGERIGMGAGYYDRFLARIPGPIRVGLAFDFQLHESLEQNPWDQPVDWIITERREVRGSRATAWLEKAKRESS